MNRGTRRRAVLGGLAATAVGGAGYLLQPNRSSAEWLRPTRSLADSATFAYVGGTRDAGSGRLDVEVAMRARRDSGRSIAVFADTDDPGKSYMPPLRSFWRFEVPLDGRSPGEYELRVGDARLPVELVAESPPHAGAAVELTPRVTWRSDYVAHARGYSTGDDTGRIHVAFRRRTGGASLDTVAFRDPEGRIVGRQSVPEGVRELAFPVEPLVVYDADAELVGFRDGREVDAVPMFYH